VEQKERVLVKDDGDLFSLVRRLTEKSPPVEWKEEREVWVPVEILFSVLLGSVERLSEDNVRLLY